ncbi:cadherin-5 [Xenentodon cancila]
MMAWLQPWTGLMPVLALSFFLHIAQISGLLWVVAEKQASFDIVKKESHPVLVRQKREWIWNAFYVEEEKPGPFPHKIAQLKSTLKKSIMKFKIDGEGANTIFFVDDNGDLFARKSLDREEKATYSLSAQMFDGNSKLIEDSGDFIIQVNDINDNKPVFPKQYIGSVLERSKKGTKVIDAVATDADDPSTANGQLFYSLIHGGDTFAFEINSTTGAISCKTNTLDRETKSQYVVVVQAQDMGGRDTGSTATTSVIINITDINDNLASFTSNTYEVRVPENRKLNEEIITLDLMDKDEIQNKEPVFSIPSFHKDIFNVKRNSNKDAVLTLKQALDYETMKSYTFTVEVQEDLGPLRADNVGKAVTRAQVTVRVSDVDEPPVFSRFNYTFTVPEDKEIHASIGTVTARDPDAANKAIRYSILEDCPIGINPVTGQLSIARKLDRELEATHVFQVKAQEELSGLESYAKVKIIVQDVNDNPPEVSVDEVFVCDNDVTNTVIGILRATDKDEQPATFTFTQVGQSSNFSIKDYGNGSAGVILKGGPVSIDDSQDYSISVRISDGGQPTQSNDAEVKIKSCRCDRQRIPTQCKAKAQRMGVSVHALIAILLCILTILVIVILFVMRKRYQKDSLANMKNSGEIHEQLVTYDEEGGGEMDTNGYDVSILTSACHDGSLLRHPDHHPHPSLYAVVQKPPHHAQPTACKGDMAAMIEVKKDEADHDRDGFPYDTLHIYGYEGPESLAGSLSSLESSSTGSNLDYDFLNDWGPRFRALAELYGVDGTDYYHQY